MFIQTIWFIHEFLSIELYIGLVKIILGRRSEMEVA